MVIEGTILGGIVGLLGSAVEPAVNYFKERQQQRHDFDMARLQIEAKTNEVELEIKSYKERAGDDELKALLDHDAKTENHWWKAMVRPLFAYTFLAGFIGLKIFAIVYGVQQGYPADQLIGIVWDSDTGAIFGAIVMYYFGSRAFTKAKSFNRI